MSSVPQSSIDWNVLKVFIHRYIWLIVSCTIVSFGLAVLVKCTMIDLYTVSTTLWVNPDEELREVMGSEAVTAGLQRQIVALKPVLLNNQFIETQIIQNLHLNLEDVSIPPARLSFISSLLEWAKARVGQLQNHSRILGLDFSERSKAEAHALWQKQITEIIRNHLDLRQSSGTLLVISYIGPNRERNSDEVRNSSLRLFRGFLDKNLSQIFVIILRFLGILMIY